MRFTQAPTYLAASSHLQEKVNCPFLYSVTEYTRVKQNIWKNNRRSRMRWADDLNAGSRWKNIALGRGKWKELGEVYGRVRLNWRRRRRFLFVLSWKDIRPAALQLVVCYYCCSNNMTCVTVVYYAVVDGQTKDDRQTRWNDYTPSSYLLDWLWQNKRTPDSLFYLTFASYC